MMIYFRLALVHRITVTDTAGIQSDMTHLCISECHDDLFTSKLKSIFVNFFCYFIVTPSSHTWHMLENDSLLFVHNAHKITKTISTLRSQPFPLSFSLYLTYPKNMFFFSFCQSKAPAVK